MKNITKIMVTLIMSVGLNNHINTQNSATQTQYRQTMSAGYYGGAPGYQTYYGLQPNQLRANTNTNYYGYNTQSNQLPAGVIYSPGATTNYGSNTSYSAAIPAYNNTNTGLSYVYDKNGNLISTYLLPTATPAQIAAYNASKYNTSIAGQNYYGQSYANNASNPGGM